VRSCQKLPPCLIEPMPDGSKTDPLLAKAEPISDGGHTSVIMYLRRGAGNLCGGIFHQERGELCRLKISEGGGGGTSGARAETPLLPVEKTAVRQAVPLQPMEVHSGANTHPEAHGGPRTGIGRCLKEAVTPWGAHTGAGSWQDLWSHGEEPTPEQVCWQGL